MKQPKIQVPEFDLIPDAPFNLMSEDAMDGARIVREREQRQAEKEEAARNQPLLFSL